MAPAFAENAWENFRDLPETEKTRPEGPRLELATGWGGESFSQLSLVLQKFSAQYLRGKGNVKVERYCPWCCRRAG